MIITYILVLITNNNIQIANYQFYARYFWKHKEKSSVIYILYLYISNIIDERVNCYRDLLNYIVE